MAQAFRETKDDLRGAISSNLRRAWLVSRTYRAFFFAGAAAVAGAAQFWNWPADGAPTNAQAIGIFATALVFIAAVVSIFSESDASSELRIAHNAVTQAEQELERLDDIARLWPNIDRMLGLYNAVSLMRDALEHACAAMVGDESRLVASLTTVAGTQLAMAAGFNLADQYTICVYRANKAGDGCRFELTLVDHLRGLICEKKEARVWPEGRGVAGIAFSNATEIIVGDLASDEARSVFGAPDLRRNYDDERYRSIVAVPVLVEGSDKPWGVVCATNDRVGHFNHDQEPGLKNEEAIRALAKYAALAVAIVRARDRAAAPPPTVVP